MEIDRKQVEVFMVASFLIKNHGYKFVTVHQNQDEIWLGNASNMEFPVIRVSSTTTEAIFFDRNRILQVHNMILKALKREGRLLDLHLSDETEVETDPDFEQSILNHGVIYGKNVSHYFPLLKSAVTPFDDPKAEFARLNRELEDYQRDHKKQKEKMKRFHGLRLTHGIIILCVVMFALIHLVTNLVGVYNTSAAILFGAYYRNAIVVYHEYWRFLTVGLTHISVWHLLMNMYSLSMIGPQIEDVFGKRNFLLILLGSTITGSMLMYIVDNTVLAVGISGGLYGLMAAFIVFAYSKGLFRIVAFRNSILQMLMINLLINLMPNIAVSAHLGGFIGGLILSFLLLDYKPWKELKKHAAMAGMIILIFFGYRAIQINTVDQPFLASDIEVIQTIENVGFHRIAEGMIEKAETFYQYPVSQFITRRGK